MRLLGMSEAAVRSLLFLSGATAQRLRSRRTSTVAVLLMLTVPNPNAHYRHYRGHLLPDPRVTPGEAIPLTDTSLICSPGYATRMRFRKMPPALKAQVYANYGMHRTDSVSIPPSLPFIRDTICCEIDHLISLELGGSNGIRNLWPEPYPDATAKDRVENALHWLVCHARLPLGAAQRGIAKNWVRFSDSLIKAGNWVSWGVDNVR